MIEAWLRDLPIRRKLTTITLIAASAALVGALAVFLTVQVLLARDAAVRDLQALARIVADNAAGSLTFGDQEAARATLESLRAGAGIERARLLDARGQEFGLALFQERSTEGTWITFPQPEAVVVQRCQVWVSQPVVHAGEALGRLELHADVRGSLGRLVKIGLPLLVLICAAALGLTYLLVTRLLRPITEPLYALATAAHLIAAKNDYSVRVPRRGNDEVGDLTDAFNRMVQEVGERDLALSAAKQQLAGQVAVLQHEISERERAEAELQRAKEAAEAAARSKSAFLAAMSHEIRTPMNGVLATAGLLIDSRLNEEQRELAGLIRVCGEGLLAILNDILDFSKIEAGRVKLEENDFDLAELIEDVVELQALAAASKDIEVAADIALGIPTLVRGDPHRLRQVLMNIVGNAVKFTDTGEVVVVVSTGLPVDGRLTYQVEVRDTGIGIPEDAQSQLFAPFNQADASTTRRFGGTGLGLAISKGLVELMGGTISARSQPGAGSTFEINLPLGAAQNALPESAEDLAGQQALLIEPVPARRQRLRRQLARAGIRCVDVADTDGAAAVLASPLADKLTVALISRSTCSIAGREAVRRLATHPVWSNRPILVMADQSERVAGGNGKLEGAHAVMFRPVRNRQLRATFRRLQANQVAVRDVGATAAETEPSPEEISVLFVEDNAVNQRVGTLMLKKYACRLTVAVNGLKALQMLEQEAFDLILMDCQMPILDGYDATRRIRELEGSGAMGARRPNYIVAMTANAMEGDRERCLEAGMDDYLAKPIQAHQLKAVVEAARVRRVGPTVPCGT